MRFNIQGVDSFTLGQVRNEIHSAVFDNSVNSIFEKGLNPGMTYHVGI